MSAIVYDGKQYNRPNYVAEKWDCSVTTIYRLIKEGRIKGCIRYKGSWYIPINAEKPSDFKPRHGTTRSFNKTANYDAWVNVLDRSDKLSKLYLEV